MASWHLTVLVTGGVDRVLMVPLRQEFRLC